MCDLSSVVMLGCLLVVHSVVKKVAQYMADVLEDSRDKVQENLLANGGTVNWFYFSGFDDQKQHRSDLKNTNVGKLTEQ